jgi:hypothetical protein
LPIDIVIWEHLPMLCFKNPLLMGIYHIFRHTHFMPFPDQTQPQNLVGGIPTPRKIWKSVGMIIPNIWKITMFQTTNHI